jgi:DNA-binding IclR family transcriptional regulator
MAEIKSLARGLAILTRLAEAPDGLRITELAGEFGVDKGSMSRLVRTLANHGFAEKDPETHRYVLGPQIVRLSRSLIKRMTLRDAAKPYLRQVVEATGECAHLAVIAQGQAFYIDQVESPASLRVSTGVGTLAPLHCTALGKILLAFADMPIGEDLKTYTARTITDPKMLIHHLQKVRGEGYAIDDEEYELGIRCIAVPVFDFRNKCIAAFGISGPTSRVTLEKIPELSHVVQEIGKALSARLSFKPEREPEG